MNTEISGRLMADSFFFFFTSANDAATSATEENKRADGEGGEDSDKTTVE